MAIGTITVLESRKKLGVLVSGAEQTAFQFDDATVAADVRGNLSLGQRVSFDEAPDPCESGCRRARNIRAADGLNSA